MPPAIKFISLRIIALNRSAVKGKHCNLFNFFAGEKKLLGKMVKSIAISVAACYTGNNAGRPEK